ncbi:zinc finger, CCHC-type containing protein [Tanacetum coccineum]
MLVRQKRKESTPKSSPPSQNDSPLFLLRVYLQSPSPPSYNPLRDQMINQLHNISTILDSHTNPSNTYIHAPPSPPPQLINPPSYAQLNFTQVFVIIASRKAHLLEDKQILSVGVFDEVFSIWKAFRGNTRDLSSFGEETDKTTDLHQHLSRISTHKLETASQITRNAITTHLKMASQDLQTTSEFEDKLDYLEQPIPPAHVPAQAGQQVAPDALAAHTAWVKGLKEIEEWQSVSSYVLKMKSYIDNLERLGHPVSLNLGTVNELHGMLKLHEQALTKKDHVLHAIQAGKVQKKNNKQKKLHVVAKGQNQGKRKSHWKRNYPQYLAELLKTKKLSQGARCSVSRNNMVYFSVVPRDGIFEIDLSNHTAIDSSMYAVSNKRAKLNLDSALLWYCHFGHISKKRIEKLQHDELLNSTDLRAFEKCVLERIFKKRTKNKAKTTKPDSEWKSRKKTKSKSKPKPEKVNRKSTQVNPEAKSQEKQV